MTSRYGISEYPDVPAIQARLARLTSTPVRTPTKDQLAAYHGWYEEHTPGSRAAAAEAEAAIPGGIQHNLALNDPWPLDIVKADGPYLYDVDGNRYIDFLQAGGPTVLGSNYAPVREKVLELLAGCGPGHGHAALQRDRARQAHPRLHAGRAEVPDARVGHRGDHGGDPHDWSDQVVYGLRIPGTGSLEAAGIPAGALAATSETPPGDLETLRAKLAANAAAGAAAGGTAAVILEPVGPESGTHPVTRDFNATVRDLCDEFGALLVFDEVVTGFRLGMGGAQGYYGVSPDLTVFGKCVAGGYPGAGGVGGSERVMATFAGGLTAAGQRALIGGTLSANPLSCTAGYHALLEMDAADAPVKAGAAGDRLRAGLAGLIARYGLPYVTYNFGSIVHLHTSGVLHLSLSDPEFFDKLGPRKDMLGHMSMAFAAEGVITLAGSRIYTSMADTDDVIDDALAGFERVFAKIAPA